MHYVYLYLIALPVYFALDLLWIGVIAKDLYLSQIGYIMGPVQWIPAVIFYLVFLVGLVYFVIGPSTSTGSVLQALIGGALFGFCAYAAYDLTNLATLKDWPLFVSLVDMAWGTTLGASVSAAVVLVTQYLW